MSDRFSQSHEEIVFDGFLGSRIIFCLPFRQQFLNLFPFATVSHMCLKDNILLLCAPLLGCYIWIEMILPSMLSLLNTFLEFALEFFQNLAQSRGFF